MRSSDDRDRAARDDARGRRGRRRSPPDEDARDGDPAVETLRAEPEPDWADAIRRGRDDRAARLRSVFASFDDDGTASLIPHARDARRRSDDRAADEREERPAR